MITFITPEIAIGNSEDSRNIDNKIFNSTLNVAIDLDIEDTFKWRHKIGLLDGPGNDPLTFISAVLLLHSLVKQGKRILLHCHEGKSRSVMIAATYVSIIEMVEFDEALSKIMKIRNVDTKREVLYDLSKMVLPTIKEII